MAKNLKLVSNAVSTVPPATFLTEFREMMHLTKSRLAELMGRTPVTILNWESGLYLNEDLIHRIVEVCCEEFNSKNPDNIQDVEFLDCTMMVKYQKYCQDSHVLYQDSCLDLASLCEELKALTKDVEGRTIRYKHKRLDEKEKKQFAIITQAYMKTVQELFALY